ncbi:substrate-binding domain-containing protein [Streptomyces sp. NPDC058579]|uniref:substrate-binding domain-containing protein n=1 Tax=Streptomyces sp. NPDC058579 TaxID=3346548 RepID=UPI003665D61A
MRHHVDHRHDRVLELVRARGSIRVTELASELGVSPVTLRRDVEALAALGKVQRMHGAVVWPGEAAGRAEEPEAGGVVIGMIVPTTTYIFGDVVLGARKAVEAQGGRLVLGVSGYVDSEDPVQAEHLLASGAEGLLVAPSWFGGVPADGQEEWLLACGAPTVLVERTAPAVNPAATLDRVRTDRAHGAALAVNHLASLGHRSVAAVLQEGPHATGITAGYLNSVRSLGLETVPGSPFTRGSGAEYDDVAEYLVEAVERHGVTAALVHSDEDAIVLVPRLQARGISVPEDLALVAYEDEVAALADVPLTAIAPPKQAVGELAAKLLLERLAERSSGSEPGPRQHLDLLPKLRIRASCGALQGAPDAG